jgi:glutamate-1-semialdehyde 2,1-aminomutase/spore coat polysaccharide biosynthesis protein SpsF
MANGMPAAAVCGRREVMSIAERLVLTSTYGGEALSLAAVVATIKELRQRDAHRQIWRLGQRMMDGLNGVARELGVPFTCGGLAPMSSLAFEGDLAPRTDACWFHLLKECARQGVLLRRTGPNFITAAHTDDDIDRAIAAVREALKTLPA